MDRAEQSGATVSAKRFLSLGAGVQSSTLALMIAHGKIAPVDAAIFADTQWEPKHVYRWLDWLEMEIAQLPHPFPVLRVTAGNLRDNVLAKQNTTGQSCASIPWFFRNPDGTLGMGRRQCTSEYKIKPLQRKMRELVGLQPGQRSRGVMAEVMVGISTDEAGRMKPARDKWQRNRWPLIELGMSRQDCLAWMRRKGYPTPPKSSCIGCPYHSDAQWREIKADPEQWGDVLEIDAAIREPVRGFVGRQYMHASRVPMAEVDLSTAADAGQTDLFADECEGMCGV